MLYALKEMAIEYPECYQRQDVDRLFGAAISNSGVAPEIRAILYSWYADYLWLAVHDLPAAKEKLGKSIDLLPGNSSNRLKWAQLQFIGKDYYGALDALNGLNLAVLTVEELRTVNELKASPMRRSLSTADRR